MDVSDTFNRFLCTNHRFAFQPEYWTRFGKGPHDENKEKLTFATKEQLHEYLHMKPSQIYKLLKCKTSNLMKS